MFLQNLEDNTRFHLKSLGNDNWVSIFELSIHTFQLKLFLDAFIFSQKNWNTVPAVHSNYEKTAYHTQVTQAVSCFNLVGLKKVPTKDGVFCEMRFHGVLNALTGQALFFVRTGTAGRLAMSHQVLVVAHVLFSPCFARRVLVFTGLVVSWTKECDQPADGCRIAFVNHVTMLTIITIPLMRI